MEVMKLRQDLLATGFMGVKLLGPRSVTTLPFPPPPGWPLRHKKLLFWPKNVTGLASHRISSFSY